MNLTDIQLTAFNSSLGINGQTTYTLEYNVLFTGPWIAVYLEPAITGIGDGLPALGGQLDVSSNSAYYCSKKDISLISWVPGTGTNLAKVTCTFASQQFEVLAGVRDMITWEDAMQERETCFTQDNKAIVNTANQLFAQNARVPYGLRCCTIQGVRNSVMLPPVSQWKITNSDSLSLPGGSVSAGQAWMSGSRAEEIYTNGVRQYLHNWTLTMSETHDLIVPNMGTVQLVSGKTVPITVNAMPIRTPWPLDQNGKALADGFTADQVYTNKLTFKITQQIGMMGTFGWHF